MEAQPLPAAPHGIGGSVCIIYCNICLKSGNKPIGSALGGICTHLWSKYVKAMSRSFHSLFKLFKTDMILYMAKGAKFSCELRGTKQNSPPYSNTNFLLLPVSPLQLNSHQRLVQNAYNYILNLKIAKTNYSNYQTDITVDFTL